MEHTEVIDRYLDKEMSDTERADFERRLATDEALAAELALQQKITRALRDGEARAFHQKLQEIRRKRTDPVSPRPRNLKRPFILMALFLSLGGLAWFFLWPPNPSPPDVPQGKDNPPTKIPAEPIVAIPPEKYQHQHVPALPFPRNEHKHRLPTEKHQPAPASPHQSSSMPSAKRLALAQQYYEAQLVSTVGRGTFRSGEILAINTDSVEIAFEHKDYERVLALANTFPPEHPKYNTVNWTAAHAAFLHGDCASAIFYADKIRGLKNSETRAQEAEMLLLLTYLKCGRTNHADFRALLKKCQRDRFHPGHAFAKDYSHSTKPAQ